MKTTCTHHHHHCHHVIPLPTHKHYNKLGYHLENGYCTDIDRYNIDKNDQDICKSNTEVDSDTEQNIEVTTIQQGLEWSDRKTDYDYEVGGNCSKLNADKCKLASTWHCGKLLATTTISLLGNCPIISTTTKLGQVAIVLLLLLLVLCPFTCCAALNVGGGSVGGDVTTVTLCSASCPSQCTCTSVAGGGCRVDCSGIGNTVLSNGGTEQFGDPRVVHEM